MGLEAEVMKSLALDSTDSNLFHFDELPVRQNTNNRSFSPITTNYAFGKLPESMAATQTKMDSKILNQSGFISFDSDEDFGEFESVPAGGLSGHGINNYDNGAFSSFFPSFGFGVPEGEFNSNIMENQSKNMSIGKLETATAHGFSGHGEDNQDNSGYMSFFSSSSSSRNSGVTTGGSKSNIAENHDNAACIGEVESVPAGGLSCNVVENHENGTDTTSFSSSFDLRVTVGGFINEAIENHGNGSHMTSFSSPFDLGASVLVSHDSLRTGSLPSQIMKQVLLDQSLPSGPISFPCEEIDDDDWGDFVEHSASTSQVSPWLDTSAFSQEGDSMINLSNGLPVETISVFPKEKAINAPALFAVDSAASGSGEFWHNRLLPVIDQHGATGLITPQFDQLNVLSPSVQSLALSEKPDPKPEKLGTENQRSHSRKSSLIETIASPLPLSLFGEETEKDEWSEGNGLLHSDVTRDGTVHFSRVGSKEEVTKKDKQSSSGSESGNLSAIILSLYTQPDCRDSHEVVNSNSDFNAINVKTPILFDNKHQCTYDSNLTSMKADMIEIQSYDADQYLPYNIPSNTLGLDEQLVDSDSSFSISGCFCVLCNTMKLPELDSGLKKEGINRDVKPQDCDVHISDLLDSIFSLGSMIWDKLSTSLMEEGRVEESLAFQVHIPTLLHLSSLLVPNGKAGKEKEVDHQCHKRNSFDFTCDTSDVGNILGQKKLESLLLFLSNLTLEQMANKLGKASSDVRAIIFEAEFHQEKIVSLARRDTQAAVELYSKAIATFWVLACASSHEQSLFLKVWVTIASICAFELKHALNIWIQAQNEGIHLDLLAHPEGRSYFAAVGQIYAVSLILTATATMYKPWLDVRPEEGKSLRTSLGSCKAAWVGTRLGEGVHLALQRMCVSLPSAVASWKDIEGLVGTLQATSVYIAKIGPSNGCPENACGISLLPVLLFNAISSVEWGGRRYFLPLANLWANCISPKPPSLPTIRLGTIASF